MASDEYQDATEPGAEAYDEAPAAAPPTEPRPEPVRRAQAGVPPGVPVGTVYPEAKTPMLAAILSVVPGLGNIYNGLYPRGIAFFLIQVALINFAVRANDDQEVALLVPSFIFFWLFNVFDAYRQATLLNLSGQGVSVPRPANVGGPLGIGIVLVIIGMIGIADRYLGIYIWDILEHWPIGLLGFGGWLIWRATVARASQSE